MLLIHEMARRSGAHVDAGVLDQSATKEEAGCGQVGCGDEEDEIEAVLEVWKVLACASSIRLIEILHYAHHLEQY
jgi:hypothetical protein